MRPLCERYGRLGLASCLAPFSAYELFAKYQAMKHLRFLKPYSLLEVLKWGGVAAAFIYFGSMFVVPCIYGQGDWDYIQSVWDRWQSLNAAMLAFFSSVTAFYISIFNSNKQRSRDFNASKAFLPSTLSGLINYFEACAAVYKNGWSTNNQNNQEFKPELPLLPVDYAQVFANCIRHAEPDVGDYLAKILVNLQVHNSRMREYVNQSNQDAVFSLGDINLITYFYRLGELYALVANFFEFARNLGEFNSRPLVLDDFDKAYGCLNIYYDEIHIDNNNLKQFTIRRLSNNNKKMES